MFYYFVKLRSKLFRGSVHIASYVNIGYVPRRTLHVLLYVYYPQLLLLGLVSALA